MQTIAHHHTSDFGKWMQHVLFKVFATTYDYVRFDKVLT